MERSERHRRGEASSFFFFSLSDSRDCELFSSDSAIVNKKSANWWTEPALLWDRDRCGENSPTSYSTCLSETVFLAVASEILRSFKLNRPRERKYLGNRGSFRNRDVHRYLRPPPLPSCYLHFPTVFEARTTFLNLFPSFTVHIRDFKISLLCTTIEFNGEIVRCNSW